MAASFGANGVRWIGGALWATQGAAGVFPLLHPAALRTRDPIAQRTEVMVACRLLNWMSSLGAPRSVKQTA